MKTFAWYIWLLENKLCKSKKCYHCKDFKRGTIYCNFWNKQTQVNETCIFYEDR